MKLSKLLLLLATAFAWLYSSNSSVNAQNWAIVPGSASDIGVGADGSAWSIGTIAEGGGYGIFKYNGSSFTKVPGGAVRIAVDPQGNAWVVNSNNDIFKYNGTGWEAIPGQKATDIAIGANGTIWAIGNVAEGGGYGIYKMSGTSWTKIPGGATRIAVDPQGNAWAVNSMNSIFKYNGSVWTTMPGTAKDIGIGADGSVWITGANSSISSWNGSAWDLRTGQAEQISVAPSGKPWVVNAQGQVYVSDANAQSSGNTPVVNYTVTCLSEAGYVTRFKMTYVQNGASKSFESPNMTLGATHKFTLPSDATSISVMGMYSSNEVWIPFYVDDLSAPQNICYKNYGIIGNHQWSHDCPGGAPAPGSNQIKFTHGAGFVANWQITYNQPGKPATNINPLGTTLGWKNTYTIPADATNIRILIQGATGLVWEPWRTTYDKTFPTPPSSLCIKIFGTTLDQKWNSDCY